MRLMARCRHRRDALCASAIHYCRLSDYFISFQRFATAQRRDAPFSYCLPPLLPFLSRRLMPPLVHHFAFVCLAYFPPID